MSSTFKKDLICDFFEKVRGFQNWQTGQFGIINEQNILR